MDELKQRSDRLWSLIVRTRDPICIRCGDIHQLQAAHVVPRRHSATRCDTANGRALCKPCHDWVGNNRDRWAQLIGQSEVDRLYMAAQTVTHPEWPVVYEGLLTEAMYAGVSVDERTRW